MGMTIDAKYDRPKFTGNYRVMMDRATVSAAIRVLDNSDAELQMIGDDQFGDYASNVAPSIVRAAFELVAPEAVYLLGDLFAFAETNNCVLTLNCEPEGAMNSPCVELNTIPIDDPQLNWNTSHTIDTFATLGLDVDPANGLDYNAADVLNRVETKRRFLSDNDAQALTVLAKFAIAKSGPGAQISAY